MAPAGEGGGGIPADPLAGLGGPSLVGSFGRAKATGGRVGMLPLGRALDLLLSPIRGPVTPFFGHDCIGQGQF